MSTITVCDGKCGAVSPNPETGLHEANHWLVVKALRKYGSPYVDDKGIYCRECAHRVLAAMAPLDTPLPPLKPLPRRPLVSAAGIFWLGVLAVGLWIAFGGASS